MLAFRLVCHLMLDYKQSLLFSEVRCASKKLVKKLARAPERSLGVRESHSKVPRDALSYRALIFLTQAADVAEREGLL